MKYYKDIIAVSINEEKRLECEVCGDKYCLCLRTREDNVKVCFSCWFKDKKAEYIDENKTIQEVT